MYCTFSCLLWNVLFSPVLADNHPLPEKTRSEIRHRLENRVAEINEQLKTSSNSITLISARGTAYFHLAQFDLAIADFDRMIELNPKLDSSHWRRGIALYYVKRFQESAEQFERYHSFDNVDRENGIWRYLAQVKASGLQMAEKELLKYTKDDRKPFGDVYAMFAGKLSDQQVLLRINESPDSAPEKLKQRFYAHLYIGLYSHAKGDTETAEKQLREAVANQWGQQASGGPGYMWHAARVHYNLLRSCRESRSSEIGAEKNERIRQ